MFNLLTRRARPKNPEPTQMLNLHMELKGGEMRVSEVMLALVLRTPDLFDVNECVEENREFLLQFGDLYSDPMRPGDPPEYFLTKNQAYFIAAQIDTPKAREFTEYMTGIATAIMRGEEPNV
jgi:hypothetical protein